MTEAAFLSTLYDELFPILRSLTGPGVDRSLDILGRHMPLAIETVPSGSKVYDWTVPPSWECRSAVLTGPDGETIADLDRSTLAVVNYSEPVDAAFELADLQPHLHSLPSLPDAVPYVTSYYKRAWGFCLPHARRSTLPPGRADTTPASTAASTTRPACASPNACCRARARRRSCSVPMSAIPRWRTTS